MHKPLTFSNLKYPGPIERIAHCILDKVSAMNKKCLTRLTD